ncbi:hypothetical protein GOODEAATRI_009748, partial [Goodea atripinnis]
GRAAAGPSGEELHRRNQAPDTLAQSGLGRCRPAISGLRAGLWAALEGLQFPRDAWTAFRWASLCVMENPAFPSSWDRTTSTCLRDGESLLHIYETYEEHEVEQTGDKQLDLNV